MAMPRRSFLAALGLAPAAAAVGMPMTGPPTAPGVQNVWNMFDKSPNNVGCAIAGDYDYRLDYKNNYLSLLSQPDREIDRLMRQMLFSAHEGKLDLDPDIEAMKSFSGMAKQRMQAERRARRKYLNEVGNLRERLEEWGLLDN